MTEASKAKTSAIKTKDRIIVALDVEAADAAREIVDEIGQEVGAFKVGLQLFTAAGPAFVRELTDSGRKVFLDLKFHDIPNTVARASVEAARLGVWMFNMHAGGGREMMSMAVDAVNDICSSEGRPVPIMLGVTLLTSTDATTLKGSGIELGVEDYVAKLAQDAAVSGMSGVVASPHEIGLIKWAVGKNFLIVTPGIRSINETHDDQKRVMTPAEALAAGTDYLVVGRPITAASDRAAAVRRIIEDINKAS